MIPNPGAVSSNLAGAFIYSSLAVSATIVWKAQIWKTDWRPKAKDKVWFLTFTTHGTKTRRQSKIHRWRSPSCFGVANKRGQFLILCGASLAHFLWNATVAPLKLVRGSDQVRLRSRYQNDWIVFCCVRYTGLRRDAHLSLILYSRINQTLDIKPVCSCSSSVFVCLHAADGLLTWNGKIPAITKKDLGFIELRLIIRQRSPK